MLLFPIIHEILNQPCFTSKINLAEGLVSFVHVHWQCSWERTCALAFCLHIPAKSHRLHWGSKGASWLILIHLRFKLSLHIANRKYILTSRCVSCMFELPCFCHNFSSHVGKSLEALDQYIQSPKICLSQFPNLPPPNKQTNKTLSLYPWGLQKNPVYKWI